MFDRINLINDQLVVSCVFAIVMGGRAYQINIADLTNVFWVTVCLSFAVC